MPREAFNGRSRHADRWSWLVVNPSTISSTNSVAPNQRNISPVLPATRSEKRNTSEEPITHVRSGVRGVAFSPAVKPAQRSSLWRIGIGFRSTAPCAWLRYVIVDIGSPSCQALNFQTELIQDAMRAGFSAHPRSERGSEDWSCRDSNVMRIQP